MGPADSRFASCIFDELVVVHLHAELREALHELSVPDLAVPPQGAELVLQRSFCVLHEVDEDVYRRPRPQTFGFARHLAPGNERDPDAFGRKACLRQPGKVVVVGEGDSGAPRGCGELRDACRCIGAVRNRRMRVKIDHRGPR